MIGRLFRITDRYVARTFLSAYAPLALAAGLLFVVADAVVKLDKFTATVEGSLLRAMAGYYAGMLPVLFLRFGPFLTLAAGMFAVARLERQNEIVPLKAGGVSTHRAMVPIFACGALLALLSALDAEVLIPRLAPEIRGATTYQRRKRVVPGILRDRAGSTLYAARYLPAQRMLLWPTFRAGDRVVHAESARWVEAAGAGAGRWLFEEGVARDLERVPPAGPGEPPSFRQERFGSGPEGRAVETSILPIDMESLSEPTSLLSFADLRDQYRRQRYLPRLRVQLHERITGPLSHLILLLIGLPFVLRPDAGRTGVFIGMLALIVVSATYFVITFVSHALGAQGVLPPFVAAWTPVVAFGLLGIALFDRVRT